MTRLLPRLYWAGMLGRARADAGPLLLVAVIIAVVGALAGAAPGRLRDGADAAVRDAVVRAADDADVVARHRWDGDGDQDGRRQRNAQLPAEIDDTAADAKDRLGTRLPGIFGPPIAQVISSPLKVSGGSEPRTFQMVYLTADVTWVSGSAPAAATGIAVAPDAEWPVQLGLSEADAQALGAGPGTVLTLLDRNSKATPATVSGVFRPADEHDPAWRLAPALLRPVPGADGIGITRFGGLLTRSSLPDARLALDDDALQRSIHFVPDPAKVTWAGAGDLAAAIVALKATSGSTTVYDPSPRWDSGLDRVLDRARERVAAAFAQAAVVLTGVVAASVLVLLLAADLLARRRAPHLTAARRRGAGLPTLALELLVEAAVVTAVALVVAALLGRRLSPEPAWAWMLPVPLAAVVAGPFLAVRTAARATSGRRTAANRSARRLLARTRSLRRTAAEALAVAVAVAAFVTLHQRGLVATGAAGAADGSAGSAFGSAGSPSGSGGLDGPAAAPMLGALAGGLVLLRLLPLATALALRRALRSRRPLAVFGAARAADTAARGLPLLAAIAALAFATFTIALGATVDRGLSAGAWRTVDADARLDIAPGATAATPEVAARLAAAPGVQRVVTADITERAQIVADSLIVSPRLVVVDAAAFRDLLAATPLPEAPQLSRLTSAGRPGVPALVRGLPLGAHLTLRRDNGDSIPLTAVGPAPTVGDADDLVILDAAALTAAGLPPRPNTIWLLGPGTAQAVADPGIAADVTLRADVERARRSAPLTAGLLRLAWAATALTTALALVALAVGAATSAPERWLTLSRLRTLGLRPRDARWVAAGELLPAALLAAVSGPLLGLAVAWAASGALSLRLLTAEAVEPALAPPWWPVPLLAALPMAAVAAIVVAESALRRRRRLADVLRAGER